MEIDSANLSDEQKRILATETFVADLLKIRAPKEASAKPKWLQFLESNGGTAVITVLLGGIMANIVSCGIQNINRKKEFDNAWVQARGSQALAAYQEYLKGEQQTVKWSFDLIGTSMAAADNLINITKEDFDPAQYKGKEREKIIGQKTEIRNNFNTANRQWRQQYVAAGLQISYFHKGDPEVNTAWSQLAASLSALMDCANDWYRDHLGIFVKVSDISEACSEQTKKINSNIGIFGESLAKTRQYSWDGWDSPEKLRPRD